MKEGRKRGRAPDHEFVAYYAARADHLRNTAYLLCGDWHLAEDLMQIAVTKLYQAWHRIERHDSLDQYARRVLLRAFLDERRRSWRRELSTMPDHPTWIASPPSRRAPTSGCCCDPRSSVSRTGSGPCSCCGSLPTCPWNRLRTSLDAPPAR